MGEILLKWKDHDKDLSTKLWEFFKDEYLVDFSITCHGHQKKVHKFVLAFFFPMFKESFRSSDTFYLDQQEPTKDENRSESSKICQTHCLNLDNIAEHPEDMDYLIQFAYNGNTTVPKEHADCLMHIADTMEIKSLKESLDEWHEKNKPTNKIEQNNLTCLRKLRPRTQLKKVISKNMEKVNSEDDVDLHAIADDESSFVSIEGFDDFSDDTEYERKKKVKKKNHVQNKPSQNSENDRTNEKTPVKRAKPDAKDKTHCKALKEKSTQPKGAKVKIKKTLNCPQCDYVANYPNRLQRHLETHARKQAKGPKQFPCKICKKRFESRRLLDIHRDSNCGTEPPVCKYCDFKTHKKRNLQQHLISVHHVDEEGRPLEKNVKCPDCNFVCYANHQLLVHKKSKHERMGKYKCKECNFTGPYITSLIRHERIKHQNIRNYICEECGYRFQNISHLKSHVLVKHKGVKPYKCNICNAEYSDKVCFKVHMQRHEGKVEYRFVCHICGHNLMKKVRLKLHLQKKHGMELEEEQPTVNDRPLHLSENIDKPTA